MRSRMETISPDLLKPLACEPPRGATRRRLNSLAGRCAAALLLFLLIPAVTSAYTLVMLTGRRIEIPESFIVTRATLTYEAAPGINVTLQLSTIDIRATERLNKETEGSFLRRALKPEGGAVSQADSAAAAPPSVSPSRARRTVTNRDLEASRLARQKSEAEYERRRVELGLPSLAEARKKSAQEAERMRELSRRSETEQAEAESYWRERATQLRTELAVVDAQLDYLRARLGPYRQPLVTGSYTVVSGAAPFFSPGLRGPASVFPRPFGGFSGFGGARGVGPRPIAVDGLGGGATRGQVLVQPSIPAANSFHRRPVFSGPRRFGPGLGLLAAASSQAIYDTTYDRTLMLERLHELEQVRAGLQARWRLLEDEARRAGAQPGWLRP